MRRFKVVKVESIISSIAYGLNSVLNRVYGSCGHVIETHYWGKNHYHVGDRIRCYECGREIVLAEKKRIADKARQALDEFDAWQDEEETKHNSHQGII